MYPDKLAENDGSRILTSILKLFFHGLSQSDSLGGTNVKFFGSSRTIGRSYSYSWWYSRFLHCKASNQSIQCVGHLYNFRKKIKGIGFYVHFSIHMSSQVWVLWLLLATIRWMMGYNNTSKVIAMTFSVWSVNYINWRNYWKVIYFGIILENGRFNVFNFTKN